MSPRDALHKLLDELPEESLAAAGRALAALRQPAEPWRSVLENAPLDDEGEDSEEERQAVEEARAELARGEGIPHEEAKRRLGIA